MVRKELARQGYRATDGEVGELVRAAIRGIVSRAGRDSYWDKNAGKLRGIALFGAQATIPRERRRRSLTSIEADDSITPLGPDGDS